jgi:hypothetical protein
MLSPVFGLIITLMTKPRVKGSANLPQQAQ